MKVKCIIKDINLLDKKMLAGMDESFFPTDGYIDELSVEEAYIVYGVRFIKGMPFYCLQLDDRIPYPQLYISLLFEVIDPTPSKYWEVGIPWEHNGTFTTDLFFKEWVQDYCFFENLIDECTEEKEIFSKYKKLIAKPYTKKQEIYQDDTLEYIADIVGDSWVLCPQCSDAWETEKYIGTITCPNKDCGVLLNNPYAPKKPTR